MLRCVETVSYPASSLGVSLRSGDADSHAWDAAQSKRLDHGDCINAYKASSYKLLDLKYTKASNRAFKSEDLDQLHAGLQRLYLKLMVACTTNTGHGPGSPKVHFPCPFLSDSPILDILEEIVTRSLNASRGFLRERSRNRQLCLLGIPDSFACHAVEQLCS
jgi:hypothetical protein